MKKVAILLVALALCVSLASAQSTWNYCANAPTILSVTSVTLNPDPPVLGTDDTVTLVGNVNETITGGNINLVITYYGISVFSNSYAVCSSIACPFAPGAITASIVVSGTSLPPIAPPGNYVGTATFVDQNGTELTCVEVHFTL